MSNSDRYSKMTDEQRQEMKGVRDRFEKALLDNKEPRIERHVEAVSSDIRDQLFNELLRIELRVRKRSDEHLELGGYISRFPNRHNAIQSVAAEFLDSNPTPGPEETRLLPTSGFESVDAAAIKGEDDIAPGVQVGPYTLRQPIGEGGMGAVWMAEQKVPVRRNVALKIIKAGMDTQEVIARFEAERQALALMDHPNIAKVLDAGQTNQGRPYFVMELVKGIPITKFCDEHRLPTEDRLNLFTFVCRAVQHAHQKGIIHRDIKPSNVLVAEHDGEPVVKVIDFGLAKATGQSLTGETMFTALGQIVGTPAYMCPEQAEAGGIDIDTRTDVYSLGVLLYELLTGVTPIDLDQLKSAGSQKFSESFVKTIHHR